MIATCLGKLDVIKALISHAESKGSNDGFEDEDEEPVNPKLSKFGLAGINRPILKPRKPFFSLTPVHIACHFGHKVNHFHIDMKTII